MTQEALTGTPIVEAADAPIGTILGDGRVVYMHPLDIIALRHSEPFDRLRAAMKYLVWDSHSKLDAAIQKVRSTR
jgi:hypothetical protein